MAAEGPPGAQPPPEVDVICRFTKGRMDTDTFGIQLEGWPVPLNPVSFENLAGRVESKKWRVSCNQRALEPHEIRVCWHHPLRAWRRLGAVQA